MRSPILTPHIFENQRHARIIQKINLSSQGTTFECKTVYFTRQPRAQVRIGLGIEKRYLFRKSNSHRSEVGASSILKTYRFLQTNNTPEGESSSEINKFSQINHHQTSQVSIAPKGVRKSTHVEAIFLTTVRPEGGRNVFRSKTNISRQLFFTAS